MPKELSRNERIKEASDYLRGTLSEGLTDEITGGIVEDDQQLVKFHGMYLQDDRDLRGERTRKKLEKAFAFMLRVRISGGVLTPAQWRALDLVARVYGIPVRIDYRWFIVFAMSVALIAANVRKYPLQLGAFRIPPMGDALAWTLGIVTTLALFVSGVSARRRTRAASDHLET